MVHAPETWCNELWYNYVSGIVTLWLLQATTLKLSKLYQASLEARVWVREAKA